MNPTLDPACPICALIQAAQGQPVAMAMGYLKQAERYQCRCQGTNHKVLWVHPHSQHGCQGFAAVSSATHEQRIPVQEAG